MLTAMDADVESGAGVQLSEYELQRIENMKRNAMMYDRTFVAEMCGWVEYSAIPTVGHGGMFFERGCGQTRVGGCACVRLCVFP